MKKMVLNRNLTHASTLGHTIRFVKDQPVDVPLVMLSEVMAFGAMPVDGEVPFAEEAPKKYIPQSPAEREPLIRKALEALVAENAPGTFTTAGIPHVKAISTMVGFEVLSKERDKVWQQIQEDKLAAQLEFETQQREAKAKVKAA
jgi:hypothetical protein